MNHQENQRIDPLYKKQIFHYQCRLYLRLISAVKKKRIKYSSLKSLKMTNSATNHKELIPYYR